MQIRDIYVRLLRKPVFPGSVKFPKEAPISRVVETGRAPLVQRQKYWPGAQKSLRSSSNHLQIIVVSSSFQRLFVYFELDLNSISSKFIRVPFNFHLDLFEPLGARYGRGYGKHPFLVRTWKQMKAMLWKRRPPMAIPGKAQTTTKNIYLSFSFKEFLKEELHVTYRYMLYNTYVIYDI